MKEKRSLGATVVNFATLLFIIYINYIPKVVKLCTTNSSADDAVVIEGKTAQSFDLKVLKTSRNDLFIK